MALGPWGRSLILSNHDGVFPAPRIDGPRNNSVWYKARDRVRARMAVMARHPIERFKAVATPNSVASARKGAAASFTGSDRSLKRSSSRSAQTTIAVGCGAAFQRAPGNIEQPGFRGRLRGGKHRNEKSGGEGK